MTDGHTSFLAAFAFQSLPYCMSKSGGDLFGDSDGEESFSSQLFIASEAVVDNCGGTG